MCSQMFHKFSPHMFHRRSQDFISCSQMLSNVSRCSQVALRMSSRYSHNSLKILWVWSGGLGHMSLLGLFRLAGLLGAVGLVVHSE